MNTTDVVIIGPGDSERPVPTQGLGGPSFVRPGTGGAVIRMFDGRELAISGPALQQALSRRRIRKPYIPGDPVMNGAEMQLDAALVPQWLSRGAKDLGPLATLVAPDEKPETFHK